MSYTFYKIFVKNQVTNRQVPSVLRANYSFIHSFIHLINICGVLTVPITTLGTGDKMLSSASLLFLPYTIVW